MLASVCTLPVVAILFTRLVLCTREEKGSVEGDDSGVNGCTFVRVAIPLSQGSKHWLVQEGQGVNVLVG